MNTLDLPARLPRWSLLLCAFGALAFLFLEGMTSPRNHDEDHYLGGAMMAREHQIYTDFAYSAMPLHPVLMGAVLRAFPTDHPFLLFRTLSALTIWTGTIILFVLLRSMLANDTAALLFSTFLAFNSLVLLSTNGLISCHIPALTLALAGAGALHLALTTGRLHWAALCGFFFCAAAGFKLFYLLLLPLLLAVFCLQRIGEETPAAGWRRGLAFALGTLPSGAPVLYIFARAPFAFMFNNYFFHKYNTAWRLAAGEHGRITLPDRIGYVIEKLAFTGDGAIALIILACVGVLGLRVFRAQLLQPGSMPRVWLLLALVANFGAMLPRPMHLHYLVFPLPFYLLFAASLYARLPRPARLNPLLLACAAVVTLAGGRYLFQAGLGGLAPGRWVPIALHEDARQMREALANIPEPRQVTTFSPLFAIEAGLPFEPKFAGAAFFFRLGDIVPLETQQRLGLIQQGHALPFLRETKPAAILVGFADSVEGEFRQFAEEQGYTVWPGKIYGRGILYLRPH